MPYGNGASTPSEYEKASLGSLEVSVRSNGDVKIGAAIQGLTLAVLAVNATLAEMKAAA